MQQLLNATSARFEVNIVCPENESIHPSAFGDIVKVYGSIYNLTRELRGRVAALGFRGNSIHKVMSPMLGNSQIFFWSIFSLMFLCQGERIIENDRETSIMPATIYLWIGMEDDL
jgi:hypothetical protein